MDRRHLWAPWRMGYVTGETEEEGCFFCRKAAENDDPGNFVVARSERSFALLNRYPYNNGHLLIAPYRHTGEIEDLDGEEVGDLFWLLRRSLAVLRRCLTPEGWNIGFNLGQAGGAGVVDHLHLHLVPRWTGDTNFMPVISDTRVIPQSLAATGRLLRREFLAAKPSAGAPGSSAQLPNCREGGEGR